MQKHNFPAISPVVDWSIGPILSCDNSIAVRLGIALPDDVASRAQFLLLTPEQALAIADDLRKSVQNLGALSTL